MRPAPGAQSSPVPANQRHSNRERGYPVNLLGRLALLAFVPLGQPAHALPAPAGLSLPVSPTCVTSPFGPRRRIGPNASGFHGGIDLSAPAGGAIRAAADGQIIAVHKKGVGGLELLIQHGDPKTDGYVTLYSHLGMLVPAIAEGRRRVRAGEKIAVVGRTGVTYGTHLYFGLLLNGRPIDPEPFLPVNRCGS